MGQIRAAGLRRQHPGETLETSEKENNTNQNNTLAKGVSQDKMLINKCLTVVLENKRPHSENMITLKVKQQDVFILAS